MPSIEEQKSTNPVSYSGLDEEPYLARKVHVAFGVMGWRKVPFEESIRKRYFEGGVFFWL